MRVSLHERLLTEATANLEKKRHLQINATTENNVDEIMDYRQKSRSTPIMGGGLFEDSASGAQRTGAEVMQSIIKRHDEVSKEGAAKPSADDLENQDVLGTGAASPSTATLTAPRPKHTRRKMLSVPGRGAGWLFGVPESEPSDDDRRAAFEDFRKPHQAKQRDKFFTWQGPSGTPAEIHVDGMVFNIRISEETLDNLRKGANGEMVDGNVLGVTMASEDAPVVNMLHGYVRTPVKLGFIWEEAVRSAASEISEESSEKNGGID